MGFEILPMLEGVTAFALTMVGLCFAVSSILEMVIRTFHWRAKGFLQQLEYLFRNDVAPRMEALAKKKPETGQSGDTTASTPVDATAEEVWQAFAAPRPVTKNDERLLLFLVDMAHTSLPRPNPGGGVDPRMATIEHLLTMARYRADGGYSGRGPLVDGQERAAGEKPSFRDIVEGLTPEEVTQRLAASRIGQAILHRFGKEAATAQLAQVHQSFDAFGRAATDRFQRRCRHWTIAIGLALAFLANVDAFALINSYLSDRQLAAKIVEQNARILGGPLTPAEPMGPSVLVQKVEALEKSLRQMADASPGVSGVKEAVESAILPFKQADGLIRGQLVALRETFPIGWGRYPHCPSEGPVDPRCPKSAKVDLGGWTVEVATDTAGLLRWLMGVLVTALFLGLGGPFWIELVRNLLRGRDLIRNLRDAGSGPAPEAGRRALPPRT